MIDLSKGHGQSPCHDSRRSCTMLEEGDLDVLIRTGLSNPVAIGFAKNLLQEAQIPFFGMDQNLVARQESGNFIGWWSVRVPRDREADAREILLNVEEMR